MNNMIKEIYLPKDPENPSLVDKMKIANFYSEIRGGTLFSTNDLKYGELVDLLHKECSERELNLIYLDRYFTDALVSLTVDYQLYKQALTKHQIEIIKEVISVLQMINATYLLSDSLNEKNIKQLEEEYKIYFWNK